jgi:hypothetical protein
MIDMLNNLSETGNNPGLDPAPCQALIWEVRLIKPLIPLPWRLLSKQLETDGRDLHCVHEPTLGVALALALFKNKWTKVEREVLVVALSVAYA